MWYGVPQVRAVLALGLLLFSSEALALRCADLPAPIYAAGAASVAPVLHALSQPLLKDASQAVIVYQGHGSCAAVEALVRDTGMSCQQGACISGTATFYTQDGAQKSCDLAAGGTHLDVAFSDVFAQSCPALGGGAPKGVLDILGPVSAHALVEPRSGPEGSIHADEGHFVFGFGKGGGVLPWINEDAIVVRDERSAGQVLLGLQLQVPAGRFKGVVAQDPADVISKLLDGDPSHGIGFVPVVVADSRRTDVKVLAFQALSQQGAFYPDRKAGTFDKINVRDGHYPIWGYLHMMARADDAMPDRPKDPGAARLIDLLTGKAKITGYDPDLAPVRSGLIPLCAMKVKRATDASPLTPYAPAEPCGCWFEKNVPMGLTACTACTDDKSCGGDHCRRGYCEVQP